MPEGSRFNGNLRLIIYILLGAVTIGSTMYAVGSSDHDSLQTHIEENVEDIRCLEKDSVMIQTELQNIKLQLEKQDDKLDRILESL